MRITVSQADIDAGVRNSGYNCPIARASGGIVYAYTICLKGKLFCLPKSAINFIKDFDALVPVRPFSFKLGPMLPF